MESASDKAVWEYARNHNFVLVTQDSDFYNRSLLFGFPPKVIWIQTGNIKTESILNLIEVSKEAISNFENDKDVGCLEIS
jgi:predicted nuclease of predicted toxin-antitoxin system